MKIYFFCEVNENKEPKFYEQLQAHMNTADCDTVFVVSPEYVEKDNVASNVRVLSEDIMETIDCNLSGSEKRDVLLSICRIPELEKYMECLINDETDNFMFSNGVYCSMNCLEEDGKVINYVLASETKEKTEYIVFYKEQIDMLNQKVKEQENHISFAQECLQVRELQLLESETRKAEVEEILRRNDVEELQKKIQSLDHEAQTYYDLYMKAMTDVNVLKEEKLSLQKQMGKKSL